MHAALPPTPADPRLQPAEPTPSCSSSRLSAALLPFGFIKLFSTETILIWIDLQFSSTPSCGLAAGAPPLLQHAAIPRAAQKRTPGLQRCGMQCGMPWVRARRSQGISAPRGRRGFPSSPPTHTTTTTPQLCPAPRAAAATCRQCGPAAGHSCAHPAVLCAPHPHCSPHTPAVRVWGGVPVSRPHPRAHGVAADDGTPHKAPRPPHPIPCANRLRGRRTAQITARVPNTFCNTEQRESAPRFEGPAYLGGELSCGASTIVPVPPAAIRMAKGALRDTAPQDVSRFQRECVVPFIPSLRMDGLAPIPGSLLFHSLLCVFQRGVDHILADAGSRRLMEAICHISQGKLFKLTRTLI